MKFHCCELQRLADHLGRRLLLGRERRPGHWREQDEDGERYTVQFPGRVILDGIELLRAAFYRFESFSLEHVANTLLGDGKLLHGADRGGEITRQFIIRHNARGKRRAGACDPGISAQGSAAHAPAAAG